MSSNDADGMANSVDPDRTALLAVWSGSALFAQAYVSKNLGSLHYHKNPLKNRNFAVITLKFEQGVCTIEECIQKMRTEWHIVWTQIRLLF